MTKSGLVGRVVPSTRSRSSSSGRQRARSAIRSSTPSMGTRRPRLRAPPAGLGQKTSVSQLQDAHEPAETRDARYPSREDVYHELDCAGAMGELLQKEIALLHVQLGPTESAHGFGDTVSCPFYPWLQLTNGKGCLYMHLVCHHGPERRCACSGTEQVRAATAFHQCDLFRGTRPADNLARPAELTRCSVGPLSCIRRLRVDKENRVMPACGA